MDPRPDEKPTDLSDDEAIEKPPFTTQSPEDDLATSLESNSTPVSPPATDLSQELKNELKTAEEELKLEAPEQPEMLPAPEATPLLEAPKKSRKKVIIVILVVVAVITILGLAWYVFASTRSSQDTKTDTTSEQETASEEATTESSIDDAVNALTDNSADEATLSETDDSSAATDASTQAGNVGEGVDETSF